MWHSIDVKVYIWKFYLLVQEGGSRKDAKQNDTGDGWYFKVIPWCESF